MVGVLDLVVKAMANDDSLKDTACGVFKDLMNGKSASTTANEWGITEIVGRLGSGGFACVYAAKVVDLGTDVAIKISSDLEKDSPGNLRTKRELETLRDCLKKSGRNSVVNVLDDGECEGRPFFVMERLHSAEDAGIEEEYPLERFVGSGVMANEKSRINFIRGVLASVAAVHKAGYIHRDIKAGNILYRKNIGLPLLVDFGSAVKIEEDVPDFEARYFERVTGTGESVVTPGRAPADLRFRPDWDIFSIGHLIRDMFGEDVPMAWGRVINKCISQRPENRYHDVESLDRDIERLQDISQAEYREQRRIRIRRHREQERELDGGQYEQVAVENIMVVGDSQPGRTIITIDLNRERGRWYEINQTIELRPNTVLNVNGPGVLKADIVGPSSSVVVLRDFAVLHNTSDKFPPENALLYVLTGPGTYLHFPNVRPEDIHARFFQGREKRRIFTDLEGTTALRFGASQPDTFNAIANETLHGIEIGDLPEDYKKVLIDYFNGKGYDVNPLPRC